ncbi:hypothetical protein H4R18_002652 [Coemansia javaensis]|uniref:Uncharacterized protein n=1 Tax=Coemansia javaensis TaxID=2761396 RepID=A0A9W8LIE7_9FUNG|nr:hypothetical protein H4R18_002652 [Coemansia javaensis]
MTRFLDGAGKRSEDGVLEWPAVKAYLKSQFGRTGDCDKDGPLGGTAAKTTCPEDRVGRIGMAYDKVAEFGRLRGADVPEYNARLDRLAAAAGITGPEALKAWYLRKLPVALRGQVHGFMLATIAEMKDQTLLLYKIEQDAERQQQQRQWCRQRKPLR